jgi:hypothetical protein
VHVVAVEFDRPCELDGGSNAKSDVRTIVGDAIAGMAVGKDVLDACNEIELVRIEAPPKDVEDSVGATTASEPSSSEDTQATN